jgi:NADH:ubiquinone oxidoreductase subunit 6 (subunit J)
LVFEVTGLLLLAAVVAATVLARRPTAEETGGDV